MKDTKITPEEYNNILKSLELKSISLIESGFKISDENNIAGKVNLKMSDKYSYDTKDDIIIFHASFKFTGSKDNTESSKKSPLFSLTGKYSVIYSKCDEIQITNDFFEVFKEISLSMIVWPYIREYIQSTIVRSGLPPFTLPVRRMNE